MPEHSVITDPNIHEPKGVASAQANQIYISDGVGSGTWTYSPLGWGFYQDAGAAQVFNTTAARLSIDGAGALNSETYLPPVIRGSGSLWDTTNDKITPIELGDGYDVRLDLPVTAKTGSPTELTLQLDISGAGTPTTVILSRFASLAKTPPYTLSIGFPLVALTSTTVTGGVQFFASTDTGSVTITNPSILIKRDMSGSM